MESKEIGQSLSLYMWHMGKFLTELMIVSKSTNSPIIVQTFRGAGELFDTLGSCIYGSASYGEIYPKLHGFIELLDYDAHKSFAPILDYAHDFSKDLLVFLGENNLKLGV